MRAGLWLDEISLLHGVPPWELDAERSRPSLRGRLAWRSRAIVYRLGLRRLAVAGLAGSSPR